MCKIHNDARQQDHTFKQIIIIIIITPINLHSFILFFSLLLLFLQSKIVNEPMSADLFLDRYSLPRIARLIAPSKVSSNYDEKVNQSSASAGAKSGKKSTNHGQYQASMPINVSSDTQTGGQDDNCSTNNNGELFLLYRHLKKYKIYHAVNGKTSGTNRKKGTKIPQDFTGEFYSISSSHY